jgi:hypothetical protein
VAVDDFNCTILQICEQYNITIPRFCYHRHLSIAGNCRICMVELEGVLKPVLACSTSIEKLMSIYTHSVLVQTARENVLEFLLINHPLDCPVCDQGGECDLQDISYSTGSDAGRYGEVKRSVEDKYLGPVIKTVMTRCIHCTRCIRYSEEIVGTSILGIFGRNEDAEVATYVEQMYSTEIAGNVSDLCPVGALTLRPHAFEARPWEPSTTATIDILDTLGSSVGIDVAGNAVVRLLPIANDTLNNDWITDKIRFIYEALRERRLVMPMVLPDNQKWRAPHLRWWLKNKNELDQTDYLINIPVRRIAPVFPLPCSEQYALRKYEQSLILMLLKSTFPCSNHSFLLKDMEGRVVQYKTLRRSRAAKCPAFTAVSVGSNKHPSTRPLNVCVDGTLDILDRMYANKLSEIARGLSPRYSHESSTAPIKASGQYANEFSSLPHPDLRTDWLINSSIEDICTSETFIFLETNLRLQCSILNARIHQSLYEHPRKCHYFGSADLMLSQSQAMQLGSSNATMLTILEGKSRLCKTLTDSSTKAMFCSFGRHMFASLRPEQLIQTILSYVRSDSRSGQVRYSFITKDISQVSAFELGMEEGVENRTLKERDAYTMTYNIDTIRYLIRGAASARVWHEAMISPTTRLNPYHLYNYHLLPYRGGNAKFYPLLRRVLGDLLPVPRNGLTGKRAPNRETWQGEQSYMVHHIGEINDNTFGDYNVFTGSHVPDVWLWNAPQARQSTYELLHRPADVYFPSSCYTEHVESYITGTFAFAQIPRIVDGAAGVRPVRRHVHHILSLMQEPISLDYLNHLLPLRVATKKRYVFEDSPVLVRNKDHNVDYTTSRNLNTLHVDVNKDGLTHLNSGATYRKVNISNRAGWIWEEPAQSLMWTPDIHYADQFLIRHSRTSVASRKDAWERWRNIHYLP